MKFSDLCEEIGNAVQGVIASHKGEEIEGQEERCIILLADKPDSPLVEVEVTIRRMK